MLQVLAITNLSMDVFPTIDFLTCFPYRFRRRFGRAGALEEYRKRSFSLHRVTGGELEPFTRRVTLYLNGAVQI